MDIKEEEKPYKVHSSPIGQVPPDLKNLHGFARVFNALKR